ncbi:hypothetical protein BH11PLA2_BH11PLA2_10080 [soil metagenome]
MSETTRKIKDGIVDAADAMKTAGKKAVDKVGEGANIVGEKATDGAEVVKEKAKDAAAATGKAVEKAGEKLRKQGE